MNLARAICQNGVAVKPSRHHRRQRRQRQDVPSDAGAGESALEEVVDVTARMRDVDTARGRDDVDSPRMRNHASDAPRLPNIKLLK